MTPASRRELRGFVSGFREKAWEKYWEGARSLVARERVQLLGHLPHDLLRHLYPCVDLGVFPSVLPEAGPLVYLETLASGCPALGTRVGGMAGWARAVSKRLPRGIAWPALDPNPGKIIQGLVKQIPRALELGRRHRAVLRQFAVEAHDWRKIAAIWMEALRQISMPSRGII